MFPGAKSWGSQEGHRLFSMKNPFAIKKFHFEKSWRVSVIYVIFADYIIWLYLHWYFLDIILANKFEAVIKAHNIVLEQLSNYEIKLFQET